MEKVEGGDGLGGGGFEHRPSYVEVDVKWRSSFQVLCSDHTRSISG